MKKYISILLSTVMLFSAISAYAENDNNESNNDATMSIDVIENQATFEEQSENLIDENDTGDDESVEIVGDEIIENNNAIESMGINADSETDYWTSMATMNSQRAGCELISINGVLYAIAGMGNNGYLTTIEKYNTLNNQWQMVTEIPNVTKGFGVVSNNSKIYIIGGYDNSNYLNVVQIYDINSDTWSTLTPMKEKRDQPAVLYMDNKIYVFGGKNENGFVDSYEYYDFSNNTWNEVTTGYAESMIRVGAHAQYINGYVCIYGGIDKNYSFLGVDMYSTNNLKDFQTIVESGCESVSIAWGADKALVFDWNRSNNTYDVHEIRVDNNEISFSDVLFENTSDVSKYSEYVIHNGYLYAIGGYNITTKKYLGTVNKYSVYYGDYSIGDGTINSTVTAGGNSITLNVEAGREYMIFVNVNNASTFDGYTFKIEYADGIFSVEDGCALTADKDLYGSADGTDILITENTSNGIKFKCTEELSGEETVTKPINAILLKANASGRRTIKYNMIHE